MKTTTIASRPWLQPELGTIKWMLVLALLLGALHPSWTLAQATGRLFGTPAAPGSWPAKGVAGVRSPWRVPAAEGRARGTWAAAAGKLAAPQAVPTITSLSPPSVAPGAGAFTLVVTGTGFEPASEVRSTAPVSATTYISATQLSVQLPAGAVVGTYPVTVTNPGPNGGTSAPFNFYVASTSGPAPTITSFSPGTAVAGTVVTVTGTNLGTASSVTLNGVSVGSFTASATQLTFTVSSTSSTGRITVTTPGGIATSTTNLVVTGNPVNPVPTITSLSPPSVPEGSGAFTLLITGTGFLPGSTVTFSGFSLPITYISATQISVALPAGATQGTYPVVVTNPAPGGGSSAPFNFIVPPAPAPTISSFAPASAVAGTTVTVTGTNLTSTYDVELNGSPVSFNVVSATQLTFLVTSTSSTGRIVVTTSGGMATSATNLVVTGNPTNPVPTITSLSPPSVPPGIGAFTLVVTGTGFVPTSEVRSSAPVSMTRFISATQLSVDLPPGAVTGTYPVTVTNPAPGGGTSAPVNFIVTAAPVATITSFSPNSGPVGTTVTVTGTNLQSITGLMFNNLSAGFVVTSPTQLTTVVPSGATTGRITVVTSNASNTSATPFTVTLASATQAEQERAGFALYPNPAHDQLTVALPRGMAPAPAVRVYDLTGRLLRHTRLGADGQVSLQGLPAGLYTLTVGEGAEAITHKLAKE